MPVITSAFADNTPGIMARRAATCVGRPSGNWQVAHFRLARQRIGMLVTYGWIVERCSTTRFMQPGRHDQPLSHEETSTQGRRSPFEKAGGFAPTMAKAPNPRAAGQMKRRGASGFVRWRRRRRLRWPRGTTLAVGRGARTRTWTDGFKVRSATITQSGTETICRRRIIAWRERAGNLENRHCFTASEIN